MIYSAFQHSIIYDHVDDVHRSIFIPWFTVYDINMMLVMSVSLHINVISSINQQLYYIQGSICEQRDRTNRLNFDGNWFLAIIHLFFIIWLLLININVIT